MAFPNPTINTGNIPYKHYRLRPRDFGRFTDTWEYEDGGMDFNRRTSSPPYIWEIEFLEGRTEAEVAQFDTFWEANGIDTTFDFTDPAGATHNGVRILEYSRSHAEHRRWEINVVFVLIKYP